MHPKKLNRLKEIYKERDCIWGITTTNIGQPLVGSPCMAIIPPFTPLLNDFRCGPIKITDPEMKNMFNSTDRLISAQDLYKINTKMANSILSTSIGEVRVIIPFDMSNTNIDIVDKRINNKSFYFTGQKPIIFDSCKLMFLENMLKSDIESLPDIVNESLKDFRFMTLVINKIGKSKVKELVDDIKNIIKIFKKQYPNNTCVLCTNNNINTKFLITSLSITFYRLEDSISIFDSGNINGLGVEIVLANSYTSFENIGIMRYPSEDTYRFVFSKNKENVFVIDGEKIKRQNDLLISQGIEQLVMKLDTNAPNDSVDIYLKGTKEEKLICAE